MVAEQKGDLIFLLAIPYAIMNNIFLIPAVNL